MTSANLSLVLDPLSSLNETPSQTHTTEEADHHDFISLLGLAQKLGVPFLPITWQPALDQLGEGASAEVYQSTIYKSLALAFKDSKAKRIDKRRIGFRDIMKEILIVRTPYIRKSPSIIDLLGISWNPDSENQIWPVLVYRKGTHGTLRDYISNHQQMMENVVTFCSGILRGLATLHSAGVIHGDLKPENIIIQQHNNWLYAVISDFGFSSISHCDDALINIPCSQPWTAPEHHANKHSFEKAKQMDVFSFGLIFLWMMLDRLELSDLSYKAQLDILSTLKSERRLLEKSRSILDQAFVSQVLGPDEREVGGQILRILECCLQHDPQLRAKSACEVFKILREMMSEHVRPLEIPAFNRKVEEDLSLLAHTTFTVQKSISELSAVDFRVRRFILDQLSRRTDHACDICRERAKYELVVALKLGFGGHSITKIHFDDLILSAAVDDADLYSTHALKTIGDIATSSSINISLPTIDSNNEWQSLDGLVQADLVHEYQRRRDLEIAVQFYNEEIKLRIFRLGQDHTLVLVLQGILVQVYEACGNLFASQEISKAIYESLDRSLGPDHPSTLEAMAQYALQSINAGQPGLAISLGEDFLRRGEKTFTHGDTIYVTGISNLGLAYSYLELYSLAETAFEAALERHGALGASELDRSKIQINLAMAIKAQGGARTQEAEKLLMQASSHLEKNLGYLHRDTISSLATRAFTWYSGPGFSTPGSDVVQFRENVVTITKEFLGSQHPDTLVTMADYAACLSASGSWNEAKALFEEVLETLPDIPSDTSIQQATIMANFAVSCNENGDLDRAEELALRVLSFLKGSFSPLGPQSILAKHAFGILMNGYRLRDDTEKAEIILMMLWDTIKDGSVDLLAGGNFLNSFRDVAIHCMDKGHRASEMHDMLLELLELVTRCNGPKHIDTINLRLEVAESFGRKLLYSEAEKIHLETFRMCQEELGPHFPTTLTVMSNLALIYYWQMKEDKAADLMYQVYLVEAETLGPSHIDTICSAGWVMDMRQHAGIDCSLEMFPGIFDSREKLGGTDRDSIEAKITLASGYESLEHVDEALEILQGAVRACKRRFGDTDLLTLRAWKRLAGALRTGFLSSASSYQLERAKDIIAFVFKEYHKILGEYHEDTIEAERLLGRILRDKEFYTDSELHFRHTLLAVGMLPGENVYRVIEALQDLLKLYEKQRLGKSTHIVSERISELKRGIVQHQTFRVNPEDATR